MKKLKLNWLIIAFISLSIAARIIAVNFFADTRIDNEWGILVHNLEISGILGMNVVVDDFTALHKLANPGDTVLPSVFMPPLYAYFIYCIKLLSAYSFDFLKIIFLAQIFLSLTSIYLFFNIIKKFESFNTSFLLTFIFSFFPIYVYSSSQVSSIVLQICLLLFYFYFLIQLVNKIKFLNLIFFSIFSGLLILIRGEFIFFYFITLIYFFFHYNRNLKYLLLSLLITLIIISPYLKRNYYHFNEIVLTKSFGYNILKGNNPDLKVEGSSNYVKDYFDNKKFQIRTNNRYEVELDDYYKNKAFQNIQENPKTYFILYLKKVFSFFFFDLNSTYLGYYNILHIIPKIVLSILSFCGAFMALKKKGFFQFLSIFYFSNIFLFSIFFILPRYSLILLPVQLLLSIQLIKIIFKKIGQLVR